MKKLFLSTVAVFATVAGFAAENLITNPGFETGTPAAGENILPGWKVRGVGGVWKYHKIVKESPKSGVNCGMIKVGENDPEKTDCYFSPNRNIKIEAGKSYRFSFWAKNLGGNAFVRIVYLTPEGKYWDNKQIKIVPDAGKKEWKQYTIELKPRNPYLLNIMAMLSGRGEVYVDDFVLEEITPAK